MSALVSAGLVTHSYLLTTRGCRTGRARKNPVLVVGHDGRRWLVAQYGAVSWVHNARAAGQVRLARRRDTRAYAIREVDPPEAGPVLQQYVQVASATRQYFQADQNDPVGSFIAEARQHPVFELTRSTQTPGPCPQKDQAQSRRRPPRAHRRRERPRQARSQVRESD
jgi:deazaflavin-dependent oxidoreductase (nitroreductase family)